MMPRFVQEILSFTTCLHRAVTQQFTKINYCLVYLKVILVFGMYLITNYTFFTSAFSSGFINQWRLIGTAYK